MMDAVVVHSSRSRALLVVVVAVLTVVVVAAASGTSGRRGGALVARLSEIEVSSVRPLPFTLSLGRVETVRVDATSPLNAVSRAFGVLLTPPTPSDDVVGFARFIRAARSRGADLAMARRTGSSASSEMWVAPGVGGSVCKIWYLAESPGRSFMQTNCYPVRGINNATEGDTVSERGSAPHLQITGLLPDGAGDVVLRNADGTRTAVPLYGNGYDIVVNKPLAAITYRAASGSDVDL